MNIQTIEFDKQPFITNDRIIAPVSQLFNSYPRLTPDYQSISELFPEQNYDDKEIKKARQLLGDTAKDMTSDEIKTFITEVKYLCDSILDKFEREIFNGMTLQELLNEGS